MESDIKRIADTLEVIADLLKKGLVTQGNAVEVAPEAPPAKSTKKAAAKTPVEEPAEEEEATEESEEEGTEEAEEESSVSIDDLKKLTVAALKAGHKDKIAAFVAKRKSKTVSLLEPKYHAEAHKFLTGLLEG